MATKRIPTPAELRQLLCVDFDRGLLTWRERPREFFASSHAWASWNARLAGKPAFARLGADGYYYGCIFGIGHRAHRVIFAMAHGYWPKEIDHINRQRGDNRLANLREVTRKENARNKSRSRANKSGVTGVERTKGGKWRARICTNEGDILIGVFTNFDDAVAARRAANKAHGYSDGHGAS